jgi:hypothetical protein
MQVTVIPTTRMTSDPSSLVVTPHEHNKCPAGMYYSCGLNSKETKDIQILNSRDKVYTASLHELVKVMNFKDGLIARAPMPKVTGPSVCACDIANLAHWPENTAKAIHKLGSPVPNFGVDFIDHLSHVVR